MCLKIINLLNDLYPLAMLDTEYILPKIHTGYIGARIDLISSDPNAPKYAPSPTVTAKKTIEPPKEAPVTAPPATAKPVPVTAPALVSPHLTLVSELIPSTTILSCLCQHAGGSKIKDIHSQLFFP